MGIQDLQGSWRLRLSEPELQPAGLAAPLAPERPIRIPGDIYSALLESGEIPDPYWGRNELAVQELGRRDWLLQCDFILDEKQLASELLLLELGSVDTVASLELNGVPIGSSRNMFVPFRCEIHQAARCGVNSLVITIHSAERAALAAAAALPYPVPASTYPVCSPHRNLVRKAQCMAGWDWGPCLMTGGIYEYARIVALDGPWLAGASAVPRRAGEAWLVNCEFEVILARPQRIALKADMGSPEAADNMVSTARLFIDAPAGESIHSVELRIENPELWWPAGQGAQPLYPLRLGAEPAEARASSESSGSGGSGGSERRRLVGFRELRLVNEEDGPADSGELSMALEVNHRRIFMKGANWIPQDALPARWTAGETQKLLDSALAANMNSLRVWGGGRYESEDFYEYCDRKGILLWHDFMFSCATYPASPDFLDEVAREVRAQLRRLRDHPALAIWCGNNEDLGAINWYQESRTNPARYIVDYDRLNEGTIGRLVRELDPGRPWWPSSPSAGPGNYADNWHADGAGDMHYWSVWHEGKPFSAYLEVQPRFCSEFGFQSLPSAQTAAGFAEPKQRNLTSPVMEHHQRHPRGNEIILGTMLRYFRMPGGWEETLYLSQVQQALAIKTAVHWWRGTLPRCMGILFWQLNDVWPCASWSSLEYGGRWKLLHYEARRFFAPVAPLLAVKDEKILVSVVNDSPETWAGRLELRILDFSGRELEKHQQPVHAPSLSASRIFELTLGSLPAPADSCFCVAQLSAGRISTQGDQPDASDTLHNDMRDWTFLTAPKHCELPRPDLRLHTAENPDGGLELSLSSDAPAFWTSLDLPVQEGQAGPEPRGEFSDAGFLLLPGETKTLVYRPALGEQKWKPEEFQKLLLCRHL